VSEQPDAAAIGTDPAVDSSGDASDNELDAGLLSEVGNERAGAEEAAVHVVDGEDL
jgi:hypothetical protein